MNITQEQKDDALKIVYIYSAIRSELTQIEKSVEQLNARKDALLINLEDTRRVEAELIDKIKAENPGQDFDVTQLINQQWKY